MGVHGPILAATDLSNTGDSALREGYAMASALGSRLVVCHVLPEIFKVRVLFPHQAGIDVPVQTELERKAASAVRKKVEDLLGATDIPVEVEIETGTAHAGILAAAERLGAGLIVVGPGATAKHVARSAGVPVLIARPSPAGGGVLGATDFSDPALPAVHMAADEATRRGVGLCLLHCLDIDTSAYLAGGPGAVPIPPLPEPLAEQLESDAHTHLGDALKTIGARGDILVRRLPPAVGIVEVARAKGSGLVVVGTRGRTGLARLALGSVAESVLAHAPCSVLVVPLSRAD
jgi:universal stress protein E